MSRYVLLGRLVQGDPHKALPRTDRATKKPKLDAEGKQITQFFCAIAVAKNPANRFLVQGVPDYESQKAILDADARAAWPQFFGQRPQGLQFPITLPHDCTNPKFANKIIDGDGFDEKGQPYSANEGWAGHWVIKCANGFAPKVSEWTNQGWVETIHTGRTIKCGDYISIGGDCVSNKSADSPGMYMNFDNVSFEQEGPFIAQKGGVDAETALGSRGPNAGAAGQGTAGAGQAGGHAHGGQTSGTASDQQPYSGYREGAAGAGAPPPPDGGKAPPPPSGPQMTAKANGVTYDEYKASGWTDDQLKAHGLLAG